MGGMSVVYQGKVGMEKASIAALKGSDRLIVQKRNREKKITKD